jgi:O-antigen ligase
MVRFKEYIAKLNYFFTLLFIFALSFKDSYIPTILVLWIGTWVFEGNLKKKFLSFPYSNKLFLALLFYFVLTVISIFRSKDIAYGWFHVQEKLSMIFFPIIIAGLNKKIRKNYKTLLFTFALGSFTAAIFILLYAFYSNLIIENGTWYIKYWVWQESINQSVWQLINLRVSTFSYSRLSILMHPAYFAMFLVFSIIILIYLYKQKFFTKRIYKIILLVAILFMVLMIYLLQSSAGLLVLGVLALISALYEIKKGYRKRFIFIAVFILAIGLTAILFSKAFQTRLSLLNKNIINQSKVSTLKDGNRPAIWYSSFQIIKENFWFGVGPANIYNKLIEKYKAYGFNEAAKERLNAHNQYLESFTGLGIFGFLALMYIIIGGFVYAYKHKHYLLFFLLLILSINFLFESMLSRINGILFMMLFYSMFVFMKLEDEHQQNTKIEQ